MEKRKQLQREIASLQPVDYDDLMEAADLLNNFQHYWDECETVDDVQEARKQLLSKIVSRVYVYNQRVIGIALHGDFGIILSDAALAPNDIISKLKEEIKMGAYQFELANTQNGSDGIRTRDLHLDRVAC